MRLLLDEHYTVVIAEELRAAGYDASSVKERDDLRGREDEHVWEAARAERRALVSSDVAHMMPLFNADLAQAKSHFGLVLTSDRSMPRNRNTIGSYVAALAQLLDHHRADDALADQVHWLQPRTE